MMDVGLTKAVHGKLHQTFWKIRTKRCKGGLGLI